MEWFSQKQIQPSISWNSRTCFCLLLTHHFKVGSLNRAERATKQLRWNHELLNCLTPHASACGVRGSSELVYINTSRDTMRYESTQKIVISGNEITHSKYGKAIEYNGYGPKVDRKKKKRVLEIMKQSRNEEVQLKMFESSMQRSRRNVSNLIKCNAYFYPPFKPVFITLTFKENIQDTTEAHLHFNRFMKRLNDYVYGRKRTKVKYLAVIEFQKRGAIHYHVIYFNLPFVKKEVFTELWSHGYTDMKALDKTKNVAGYVTKYMTKDVANSNLNGKKKYFCSRGLLKPIVIKREPHVNRLLKQLPPMDSETRTYASKYLGEVTQTKHMLPKGKTITDIIENFNPNEYYTPEP